MVLVGGVFGVWLGHKGEVLRNRILESSPTESFFGNPPPCEIPPPSSGTLYLVRRNPPRREGSRSTRLIPDLELLAVSFCCLWASQSGVLASSSPNKDKHLVRMQSDCSWNTSLAGMKMVLPATPGKWLAIFYSRTSIVWPSNFTLDVYPRKMLCPQKTCIQMCRAVLFIHIKN